MIIPNLLDKPVKKNLASLKARLKQTKTGSIIATPHASANGATPWGLTATILVGELSKNTNHKGRIIVYDLGKLSDTRYEPGRVVLPGGRKIKLVQIGKKKWNKLLISDIMKSDVRDLDEIKKEIEESLLSAKIDPILSTHFHIHLMELEKAATYSEGLVNITRKLVQSSYPNIEVLSTRELIRKNLSFVVEIIVRTLEEKRAYQEFLTAVGSVGRRYRDLLSHDPVYDPLKEKEQLKEEIGQERIFPSVIPVLALLIEKLHTRLHIGGEHMIHYVQPLANLLRRIGINTDKWAYFHVGRATSAVFVLSNFPERKVDYHTWEWSKEDSVICANGMMLTISYFFTLKELYELIEEVKIRQLYESVPVLITPYHSRLQGVES